MIFSFCICLSLSIFLSNSLNLFSYPFSFLLLISIFLDLALSLILSLNSYFSLSNLSVYVPDVKRTFSSILRVHQISSVFLTHWKIINEIAAFISFTLIEFPRGKIFLIYHMHAKTFVIKCIFNNNTCIEVIFLTNLSEHLI